MAVAIASLCVLSYSLTYYQGFEYHYATLLPLLPALLWLRRRETTPWRRRLMTACFLVSLPVLLPTFFFLAPLDRRCWLAATIQRVAPVMLVFLGLLVYAAALAWRGSRKTVARSSGGSSPLGSLLGVGGPLGLLFGAVAAAVYATAPTRFWTGSEHWSREVCERHLEDAISRPGVAPEVLAEAHQKLGRMYAPTDPGAALEHFRNAAACQSCSAASYAELGDAFVRLGHFDDAIQQCQKALKLDAHCPEAHNNLGAALEGRGRLDEAIEEYRKAVEFKPDYAAAHYNLGLGLAHRGRFEEAIANYRTAIEIEPDYVMALNDLAWQRATCPQATLRDGKAAIDLARRAVGLSGGQAPELLDTLAAAYAEAGLFSQATETVSKALDLACKQNKPALVAALKARLRMYDVLGTPYRQPEQEH